MASPPSLDSGRPPQAVVDDNRQPSGRDDDSIATGHESLGLPPMVEVSKLASEDWLVEIEAVAVVRT
jgi:hypothetical protein